MQIKDLSVDVERMDEVRGGGFVAQGVSNGSVVNDADIRVGGAFGSTVLTGSPISVVSNVFSANETSQQARAVDSFTSSFSAELNGSVVDLGLFGI